MSKDLFPCSGCGACCRRIDNVANNIGDDDLESEWHFPYSWDETGRCEKLDENNKCKVYDDRPLICNVEKLSEYVQMSKKDFYMLNIRACNMMMDEDDVPEEFRIDY